MIGLGTGILSQRRYGGFPPPLRAYWQRVRDDSGTMYDFNAAIAAYRSAPTASLVWAASASKEAVDYSVLPADGSGDFTYSGGGNAVSQRPDGMWEVGWPANTPRNSYNNGVLGRLIEPQRQNLISYPRSFARAEWTKLNARIEGDAATAGSEKVVNSDFSNGLTGWGSAVDWSVVNGQAVCSPTSAGYKLIVQNIATIGKLYKVEIDVISRSGGTFIVNTGFSNYLTITQTSGKFSGYLTATATQLSIEFNGVGNTVTIDNVSVKEVQGFSCPFVDANGVNTKEAFKLVEDTSNARHYVSAASIASTTGVVNTISILAKKAERNWVYIYDNSAANGYAYFDIQNGTVGSKGSTTTASIVSQGEYYRCTISYPCENNLITIRIAIASANNLTSYQGDGTSGVYICHAQAEAGATATSPIYGAEGGLLTRVKDANTVALPSGVTEVLLTDMNDVVTTDSSPANPYEMPVGTYKKIVMQ